MRDIAMIVGVVVFVFVLAAVGMFWNRFALPFQEETRRQTYQESVTAQTACRANLSRLYREWTTAEDAHRTAIEAMAVDESERYRCESLNPTVNNWIEAIR
jgi:hypothetical protein